MEEKKYTNEVYLINPDEIVVLSDRQRQLISRKPLEELIESIRQVGQLQPGVCRKTPEGSELIIGERRLKACQFLKIQFRYLLEEETDPLLLEQMQLDENLCRESLDWKEEIQAKARLHAIFQERYGVKAPNSRQGHSLADTAAHIGVQKSILHEDVTLAGYLEIPEVAAAPNKTTAKKIVSRLVTQVKRQDFLTRILGDRQKQDQSPGQGPNPNTSQGTNQVSPAQPTLTNILDQQIIYFSSRCLRGTFEEKLTSFPDESFDLAFFDPPWGVNFEKNKKTNSSQLAYGDSPQAFFAQIELWLTLIYSKLKPNSHLYMFFGMGTTPEDQEPQEPQESAIPTEGFGYRDLIYNLLHKIGFRTNRMPLIWYKKGSHVTRNPTIWPGRAYEPIAYARKGNKPLVKFGMPDVIETPTPTPKLKDIHPSTKHPQIYRELLLRSAAPGDKIIDPMAGSGMLAVAAESLVASHALDWHLIEKDINFHNLQIVNLVQGYDTLVSQEIPYEPLKSEDITSEGQTTFRTIKPGTDAWKDWWNTHPEDQEAMLDWKLNGGNPQILDSKNNIIDLPF